LVLGVYLADRETLVTHIVQELGAAECFRVEQRWAALGGLAPTVHVRGVTSIQSDDRIPKFVLINRLSAGLDLSGYSFILVVDDDIELPVGFLDEFLRLQQKYDLALAQPARTPDSQLDHAIVRQVADLEARQTRFVEIGPVVSVRRDAVRHLMPFDEASPMGWGLDYVWPVIIEAHGLRLGIIDATPVRHDLRPQTKGYNGRAAWWKMQSYLARTPHLPRQEAMRVVAEYRGSPRRHMSSRPSG
jgi:hypothetical protein